MAYSTSKAINKVMVQPINVIFKYLQSRVRVSIWIRQGLLTGKNKRFEGVIIGFDEYMNLVVDETEEVNVRVNKKHKIGRILLRGDIIMLIQEAKPEEGNAGSLSVSLEG